MGPLRELTQTDRSDIQQTHGGMRAKIKIFTRGNGQHKKRRKKEKKEGLKRGNGAKSTRKQTSRALSRQLWRLYSKWAITAQTSSTLIDRRPTGLEAPERLCALQRQRYLYKAPRGDFIKKHGDRVRSAMINMFIVCKRRMRWVTRCSVTVIWQECC